MVNTREYFKFGKRNKMNGKITSKIVIVEKGSAKNFECANCDFVTNEFEIAKKHQKDLKHELWVKRGWDCEN